MRDLEKDDLPFNTHHKVNLYVNLAVRAAELSIKNGEVSKFQLELAELLKQLRVGHGEVCKGSHGVDKENQEACDRVSLLYGQKIIRFFINILHIEPIS